MTWLVRTNLWQAAKMEKILYKDNIRGYDYPMYTLYALLFNVVVFLVAAMIIKDPLMSIMISVGGFTFLLMIPAILGKKGDTEENIKITDTGIYLKGKKRPYLWKDITSAVLKTRITGSLKEIHELRLDMKKSKKTIRLNKLDKRKLRKIFSGFGKELSIS